MAEKVTLKNDCARWGCRPPRFAILNKLYMSIYIHQQLTFSQHDN